MNAYLPLILKNMDYSVATIGILLAIFDFSGLFIAFLISSFAVKKSFQKRDYTIALLVFAFSMVILPIPLILKTGFWFSALFLSLYSIGFKSIIPFSDTLINMVLGKKHMNYGKIRVAGSIGFVCMSLILHFFGKAAMIQPRS
ncbi:MAG: MFS transporter, partial [Treponemataceae bacterium]